jgi:hypothetical protein
MSNILKTLDEKQYDSIQFRIDFIKELLNNKELEMMVNFDDDCTENFVCPSNYKSINTESSSNDDSLTSGDIRNLLNKKIHNFHNVIRQIGGKLLYKKSGTTGHTFKGIINMPNGKTLCYAVKVVAYKKRDIYGNIHDITRPENAELMMIKLLSYFVVKCQTPHIVLPIGTFNTNIEPFVSLIEDGLVSKDNKKYADFVKNYKNGVYFNQVSILMSEWANQGDLLDFIRNNYREFSLLFWKVLFFQLISVLAVIQYKYPTFRHNDLKANNVLIHQVKKKPGKKYSYIVCKSKYIIPSIGYNIKIWDFDFACIPGIVNNAKVNAEWTTNINVKPVQNRYYDMHFFFNTLTKNGFFPKFMTESCIPTEVKEFVNRIIPKKYRDYTGKNGIISEKYRILVDDEYLTPDYVLKSDDFFSEFRYKLSKSTNSKSKK